MRSQHHFRQVLLAMLLFVTSKNVGRTVKQSSPPLASGPTCPWRKTPEQRNRGEKMWSEQSWIHVREWNEEDAFLGINITLLNSVVCVIEIGLGERLCKITARKRQETRDKRKRWGVRYDEGEKKKNEEWRMKNIQTFVCSMLSLRMKTYTTPRRVYNSCLESCNIHHPLTVINTIDLAGGNVWCGCLFS